MKRFLLPIALLLWLVPSLPGTAWGQSAIALRRFRGEVGVGFNGSWNRLEGSETTASQFLNEWFRLQLSGFVVHPRILDFRLGLNPSWRQGGVGGFPEATSSPGGNSLNYGWAADLFSAAPVKLSSFGARYRGLSRNAFGIEYEGRVSSWGGTLYFPNPYVSANLSYTSRSQIATRRDGPELLPELDQTVRTLRLSAENSKTTVLLEHLSNDDHVFERDFSTDRAQLNHRLRWGKGSRLQSNFLFLDRSGVGAATQVIWSQRAHLQHTLQLGSNYSYRIFSQETSTGSRNGWVAALSALYRFGPGFQFGVDGSRQFNRLGKSDNTLSEVGTLMDFAVSLPLNADLRGGGSVNYTWYERDSAEETRVPVVNERHVVDDSRRFTLDNTFVEAASVVVSSADQSRIYRIGFDYEVVESGALTDILILPSSRIEVGDTVAIDYTFLVAPGGGGNFLSVGLAASLRVGVFLLSHRQVVRNDNQTGPVIQGDRTDIRTTAELNLPTPAGRLNLRAQRTRTITSTLDAIDYLLRGDVAFSIARKLQLSLGADATLRRDDIRPYDVVSARTAVSWQANRSLALRGDLRTWRLSERGKPTNRFLGGGLGADWRVGLVTLKVDYVRIAYTLGTRTEDRLMMSAARRF